MGVYVTIRCGHCNKPWQLHQYGANSVCGAPNVKCSFCKGMNGTKRDLYRNFDFGDKVSFFVTEVFFPICFGCIGLGIGGYFFNSFFIQQNFFDFNLSNDPWYWILVGKIFIIFISLGPLHFGLHIIYNKLNIYRQINKMQKVYDKQGGFLWSDQQF